VSKKPIMVTTDEGGPTGTFDIASISSTPDKTYSATTQLGATEAGVFFKPDGTKMYCTISSVIYQYTLSTAWDVSTASYDSVSGTASGTIKTGPFIDASGTRVFYGSNSAVIYQDKLTTAWVVSSIASDKSKTFSTSDIETSRTLTVKDDGTKIITYDDKYGAGNTKEITGIDMSTAWDITSASVDSNSQVVTGNEVCHTKADGTRVWTGKSSIEQWDLSTPWDTSTATLDATKTVTFTNWKGFFVDPNGDNVYTVDNGVVNQYYMT